MSHCNINTGTQQVPSLSPATFSHQQATGGMHPPNLPFEPALIPLPPSLDKDLLVPHVIAEAQGQVPFPKVVGACCPGATTKNKGSKSGDKENKQSMKSKKHICDITDLDDDNELPKAKQGHPQGAGNYTMSDMNMLLDCVEKELPLDHKVSSLETKYKQLVKTPKPTGTVGTCNLNDSAAAAEPMNRLLNAFNPEVQRAHDEDCANCMLATTQYFALTQQLHDAQATNDKLHGQLFDLCNQLYEVQPECDHLEMKIEMLQMSQPGGTSNFAGMYHNMLKKKYQCYKWFADGGKSLTWLMDDEDDEDFGKGCEGDHAKMDAAHTSSTPEVQ
ncbi:hypothetical protein BKA82DRAFT_11198 [Pisolithus tinctorius]|uniref:Uncharacterized protein n=1 Tax=Pisolithus tinctorius Marx 270 TaxID=870435 RepID=A0A0C3N1S1_PISTI|nr:hypothetical protein BKA82DRAFT_11198 [Pisolithus tinctorius]KIN95029.1 hypothetical protein M404DRAFT_11198 [Pisolithus tinctorius Marx 270]